jgi:hypothetical protein
MTEELGKITKPEAEKFSAKRKLFFVPLIFASPASGEELLSLTKRYWQQVGGQIAALEAKLDGVKKIYYELVPETGEKALETLAKVNSASERIVREVVVRGAEIVPIEEEEILAEFMDWSRCLSVGLQCKSVFQQVYDSYLEIQKKRNERIAAEIDRTLGKNECAVLMMREGHQVQFPEDIEVFYVAPPALDEIKRWLRDKEASMQSEAEPQQKTEEET